MYRKLSCYRNQIAMTLVEILVAIVILGIVLIAIFPLVTQSLQVTNLSNTISNTLFGDQEKIEIVAATKGGVLFSDGEFLADKYFPVFFGDIKPVPGMTVIKSKLVRFLASIPNVKIDIGFRHEGYSAEEAEITVSGYNTHFIDTTKTNLRVADKDNYSVSYSNYKVVSPTEVTFTIPTNGSRYTNLQSPYTITLSTGSEEVTSLLPIYLPRAVAVQDDGDILISSNAVNWITKETSSVIDEIVNKIAFRGGDETEACFIAVGDDGGIFRWANGEAWKKVNHNLTSENLNSIIRTPNLFIAVGNNGVILTSENGSQWYKRTSSTSQDLKAITYFTSNHKYVCVGSTGIILTSSNGSTWSKENHYPYLESSGINGLKAVKFSGAGDYLKTAYTPVTDDIARTVIMITAPKEGADTLISWGSPLNSIENGRYTFRIDPSGALKIEQDDATGFLSDVNPLLNGDPAIFISRSSPSSTGTLHRLYMNGDNPNSETISGVLDTNAYFPAQIGSDPLTRYTEPLPYKGLIAELMVFDSAVNISRTDLDPDADGTKNYSASDLDLIVKYLSDKYHIELTSINGFSSDHLFNSEGSALSDITLSTFPKTGLVLWLDANNPMSLDLENGEQVLSWKDLVEETTTHESNHASGADLNAVTGSFDVVIAGGEHRNLLRSSDTSTWSQRNTFIKYRMDDISYAMMNNEYHFVALLNDGFYSFAENDMDVRKNSVIATSTDGLNWVQDQLNNTYTLNDLIHDAANKALLTVGDHGIIYLRTNSDHDWQEIFTGFHTDLTAACIR